MKASTFICLAALVTGLCRLTSAQETNLPPEPAQAFLLRVKPSLQREHSVKLITQELNRMASPKAIDKETPLIVAIADINRQLKAHNTQSGVTQIPKLQESPEFQNSRLERAKREPWLIEREKDPPIRIVLSHVSAKRYLDYFAEEAGGFLEIEPDGLWIHNLGANGEMFDRGQHDSIIITTHEFIVPARVIATQKRAAQAMNQVLPGLDKSSSFDWTFDPSSQVLHLKATESALSEFEHWYAHRLLDLGYKIPAS